MEKNLKSQPVFFRKFFSLAYILPLILTFASSCSSSPAILPLILRVFVSLCLKILRALLRLPFCPYSFASLCLSVSLPLPVLSLAVFPLFADFINFVLFSLLLWWTNASQP